MLLGVAGSGAHGRQTSRGTERRQSTNEERRERKCAQPSCSGSTGTHACKQTQTQPLRKNDLTSQRTEREHYGLHFQTAQSQIKEKLANNEDSGAELIMNVQDKIRSETIQKLQIKYK